MSPSNPSNSQCSRTSRFPVDLPGSRRDLPVPFFPCKWKLTPANILRVNQYPPFDVLPRILVPSSTARIKPPVMHYGWPVNLWLDRQPLLDYAEKHDLLFFHCNDIDGEQDLEEEECEEEIKNDNDGAVRRGGRTINVAISIDAALERLTEELKMCWPRGLLHFECAFQVNSNVGLIISLYTNYDLRNTPSPDAIEVLRKWLGEDTPKWYMDSERFTWTTRGPRR
ncbi:hypothetical protein BKA93DRAFT_927141 [Sparassis latifolia]